MKLQCKCGHALPDSSDYQRGKGRLIPDEVYFDLFDALDTEVVDRLVEGSITQGGAYMMLRSLIGAANRSVWQCPNCHRLLLPGSGEGAAVFAPDEGAAYEEVLRGPRGALKVGQISADILRRDQARSR